MSLRFIPSFDDPLILTITCDGGEVEAVALIALLVLAFFVGAELVRFTGLDDPPPAPLDFFVLTLDLLNQLSTLSKVFAILLVPVQVIFKYFFNFFSVFFNLTI